MATIPGGAGTIPLSLRPLSASVSFRDQAYAALKQAIMEADIYSHPHELRLDERQLSKSLGVSRTPIREAMATRTFGCERKSVRNGQAISLGDNAAVATW